MSHDNFKTSENNQNISNHIFIISASVYAGLGWADPWRSNWQYWAHCQQGGDDHDDHGNYDDGDLITTTRTKTSCYYNDSQVMDSLGPQLDSAIEAAIRMLEGNAGAGRHGLPDDEDDDDR